MSADQLYVLGVLGVTIVLIVSGRLRTDLVAMLVLVSLALGGLVTPEEAFAGFASPAILTLAGLFVLTAAMDQAGIVHAVAARLERFTGASEARMVMTFLMVGAAISLVVNTAAAGAVLIPVVVSLARKHGVPVSKVLMPMGVGVVVGGMATVFTTANIIMSGLLQSRGHEGLTMFDFFPTGVFLVVITGLYMLLVGRHLLPVSKESRRPGVSEDLGAIYELDQRLWELRVLPGSDLIDKTLAEAALGFPVIAIWHGQEAEFNPGGHSKVEKGDVLLISCRRDHLHEVRKLGVAVGRGRKLDGPHTPVVMVEVVIPPRSKVVGQTLAQLRFQSRYGLTGVALWRAGRSQRTGVGTTPLKGGDALLVVGPIRKILRLTENPDYLVVDTPAFAPMSQAQSAWTLAVAVGVVFAAGLGLVSMSLAAVAGALALVLLKVLTAQRAYSSIDWGVLVLIAGMAPLAVALESTGLTTMVGRFFIDTFGLHTPLIPVALFFLFTVFTTQVVGGQVSALFVGPIALTLAAKLGVDLTAMAVLIAMACSNCFLTSVSHPVNAMIAGPGGYSAADFLKVGVGLQIVMFLGTMLMARMYWGL